MKGKKCLKKIFVIESILLLIIPLSLADFGNKSDFTEKHVNTTTTTDYFENSVILIIGKCNIVKGPLVWIFGLYIPFFKKSFLIRASGEEGEQLNVFIRGNHSAGYIDNENILVEFNRAKGILFWGKKSIITDSSRIFVICKAENIYVTTYD